ncbi:P22 coat protein - gene protein 5 [Aminobacter sp. MSH1]|uniref:P22 phage major capsid protein family protein n=1 Tax=Aminobacter sp. MSH1 TaxID=374606 RepID=UPI000D348E3C|nr:P22 phage major capsid protein family protein [Aminobacter sp. MSH1]AWC25371.1 P22 coat protein - gene protein 5 [Aminobacter sp. MSH1]
MAQTVLTADIIAKEAVMILDNELVMAKKVFRGYENEFDKKVNGFKVGETISIRKPTDFTVRDGAVMQTQEVVEGKTTITVDKRKGVDFKFTSQDLTLKIGELSERVIKPAMIQLANQIDTDLMALYKTIPSWVGTPTPPINSYADFAKGPERMDEYANPTDGRCAVLSPADHWGLLGSQTALYMQDVAKGAYRKGSLGEIGGVDTYMSQNVPTHTVGAAATASAVADAAAGLGVLSTTYEATKDTGYMYLSTDGWDASTLKAGDVLELSNVYAVNPVTKATLAFRKQFVVLEDTVTAAGDTAIKISPPIIPTGAFQNVSAVPVDGTTTIAKIGTGGTGYRQNLMFHKNAFALVTVPLISPPGAVDVARQSYKGTNVRVIPVYDGINDESAWRLDVLYGVKTIDNRLAHRISGST